jgi:hypothetical protein
VIVTFGPTAEINRELWTILVDNGLKWADEGWGGFSTSGVAILINPKISKDKAASSMDPLVQFGKRLQIEGVTGAQVIVTEFPSWGSFFDAFTKDHVAVFPIHTPCEDLINITTQLGCRLQLSSCIATGRQGHPQDTC